MRQRLGSHLTYANVMVTLLAFVVLGGGAYAAFHLPKNSVRSRNIVNGQVKKQDLAEPQPFTSVGLALSNGTTCPPNVWAALQPRLFGQVGYFRDITGRVHLGGDALRCGNPPSGDTIFTLPPGYRPPVTVFGPVALFGGSAGAVRISPGNGAVSAVSATQGQIWNLDAISFQCAPSGENGCP